MITVINILLTSCRWSSDKQCHGYTLLCRRQSIGVLGQGSSTNAQPSHLTFRRRPSTRTLRRQHGAHCNKRQPPTRNSAPNCCCSAVEPRQFIGYTPPKQDVWPLALQASSAACKYDFDMRFSCTQLTPLFL